MSISWKKLQLKVGTHSGTGEKYEGEGVAGKNFYGLTSTLTPHPSVFFNRRNQREGVRFGESERMMKGVLAFVLVSGYSNKF